MRSCGQSIKGEIIMFEFNETEVGSWPKRANEFMFDLINRKPDGFTADDFNSMCRSYNFPPDVIKRLSGKLFKEFQAADYIRKTDKYKLSDRNSSPLPVWESAKQN
jgi:hypothetical protein